MGSVLLVVVTVLLTLFFERLVPSWWHSWQRRRRERLEAERTAEMRRIDQEHWDRRYGHLYGLRYVVSVGTGEHEVELLRVLSSDDQVVIRRLDGQPFDNGSEEMIGPGLAQFDRNAFEQTQRLRGDGGPTVVRRIERPPLDDEVAPGS